MAFEEVQNRRDVVKPFTYIDCVAMGFGPFELGNYPLSSRINVPTDDIVDVRKVRLRAALFSGRSLIVRHLALRRVRMR
jgi:hypothetical protein